MLRLTFVCGLVQEMSERQEAMESGVNKTLLYLQGAHHSIRYALPASQIPCLFSLQKDHCFPIVGLPDSLSKAYRVHCVIWLWVVSRAWISRMTLSHHT